MAKIVDKPCVVAADEGEVMLECGYAAVSLTPEVAHDAADELHKHADVAADQRGGKKSSARADTTPPGSNP